MREYRAAIAIKPDYSMAHNNLGALYLQWGSPDEAVGPLRRAIDSQADNVAAHQNLSIVYRVRHEWADAIDQLTTILRLEPGDTRSSAELAMILAACPDAAQRDPTRAIALAERAVTATHGRDAVALDAAGVAYAALGQFDRALAAARAALRLVSDEPLAAAIRARETLYLQQRPYLLP